MPTQADAALVARDPDLPGLAHVLDGAGLARRAGLGDLAPTYLRYKPGTSCVAGLAPPDGALGAYAAMTYTPARYAEVRARDEWRDGPDPAVFLDDICTALVPLALDRKLAGARGLGDPARRAKFLAKLGLAGAELSLLRYKPGRRLVLLAAGAEGPRAVVKAHGKRDFDAALAGARHAAEVAGVPLLGVSEKRRALATGWIDGAPLDLAATAPEAVARVGAELARLHAAAPRPGAAVPPPDTATAATALADLLPDLAVPAGAAAEAIAAGLAGLDPAPCLIHGDFSADQVILADRPVVLDWDRMAVGDPAADLGSFLADLDAAAQRGEMPDDRAEAMGEALLSGYGTVPGGVAWHRAAALLALAGEGFRDRRADWRREAEAILLRTEALVAPPRRGTTGLARALDPTVMAPRIAAALDSAPVDIALLRERPGRRALVRYDLADGRVALAKLRAKGPDRRTPALHDALRAAGLDGRAPDRVGVPAALTAFGDPPIWLQARVPGRDLTAHLAEGDATAACRRTGRALARLHESGVPTDRRWTMAEEADVLTAALDRAAARRPDLALAGLARDTRAALAGLPAGETVGLHRDFYPDQVLIDGDAVWLVDLDLYAQGDPTIDVANMLAHLTEAGLRDHGAAVRHATAARAFLAGYADHRPLPDPARLRLLHWTSLARHVGIATRVAGRGHTVDALLALCAEGPDHPAFALGPDAALPA